MQPPRRVGSCRGMPWPSGVRLLSSCPGAPMQLPSYPGSCASSGLAHSFQNLSKTTKHVLECFNNDKTRHSPANVHPNHGFDLGDSISSQSVGPVPKSYKTKKINDCLGALSRLQNLKKYTTVVHSQSAASAASPVGFEGCHPVGR